ncbi:MAG: DNA polymerase III subunit epsilon [Bacteroidetes bacterium]|nr:MAG: DNA polymerase III subunit epsilon [Bacteroidota bacterium]
MRKRKDSFAAIDFELATGVRNSVCSVGIVVVEKGIIMDEYYSLVQPPKNKYHWGNSRVTKIYAKDTKDAPNFLDIYPEIKKRLKGKKMVAHNEGFDRNVLQVVMEYYELKYSELKLPKKWEDTVVIFQEKGTESAKLNNLCKEYDIEIKHHNALSDARATALLYLLR